MFYGEDLHNPTFKNKLDDSDYNRVISFIKVSIKDKLEKARREKLPDNILKLFIKLDYSEKEFDDALYELDAKTKNILIKHYGNNLKENFNLNDDFLKADEVIQSLYEFNSIIYSNHHLRDKKQDSDKNIYDYLKSIGYSCKEIDKAIELLDIVSLKKLYNYYGYDLKKPVISKYLSTKIKKEVSDIVRKVIPTIIDSNREHEEPNNKSRKYCFDNLYDYYISKGYKIETIDIILASLSKEQLDLLHLYYGHDLKNPKIYRNIDEDKFNELRRLVTLTIIRKFKSYKNSDNSLKKRIDNYDNLYDYFIDNEFAKEDIDKILEVLSDNYKSILYSFYDKNLNIKVNIINKEDKEQLKIVIYRMKRILKLYKNKLYNINESVYNNFYKYYEEKGFTEEQVDKLVSKLSEGQLELLHSYYGEDLKNPVINKKIDYNVLKQIKALLNSTLLKRIKNIDSAKDLKNNCKVFIYDNIFKFFESEGYEVSKIEEIIKLLTVEQQELLHKVYGEDLYNPIKVTSLSRDVLLEFRKVIISIKNRYNYPSERNRVSINNFYGYYKVYGYSESDVDYVLSKLKRSQLDTLHLFYGEDLHNPIINENLSNEEKSKVRALVITTIKNKLEKISNGENIYSEELDNIYEYYNSLGYSDEKIDTVLMTISKSCMDRLHSYYGEDLKNPVINNNLSKKEITIIKKYVKFEILRKLNGNKINTSSDNLYKAFMSKGYSEKDIDLVISLLNPKQIEHLHLYYGEDLKNPVINNNIDVKIINHVKNSLVKTILSKLKKINQIENIYSALKMLNVYNDIEKILEITKDYLSSYDDIYFNLFTNIFKLIILDNTITYRNVISLLENINNINYNDLSERIKHIFYANLSINNYKLCNICLDILLNISNIDNNVVINKEKIVEYRVLFKDINYDRVIKYFINHLTIDEVLTDLLEEEKEIVKKELYNKLCEKNLYNEAQALLKQIKVKKLSQ